MVTFKKKRAVLALVIVGVILLSICLFRPIKHLSPEEIATIKVVCPGLPEQKVTDADRAAIVESINHIFIFIPDFRPWKYQLGDNTLDAQFVIQETTGKIIRVRYKPLGVFSVRYDDGSWTDWLTISWKQGDRLEKIMGPYVWAAIDAFQNSKKG